MYGYNLDNDLDLFFHIISYTERVTKENVEKARAAANEERTVLTSYEVDGIQYEVFKEN